MTDAVKHPTYFNASLALLRKAIEEADNQLNPYLFWRGEKHKGIAHTEMVANAVSLIHPLAAMYLSMSSGAACTERANSNAGQTMTPLRNMPQSLEEYCVIGDYLRQPYYDKEVVYAQLAQMIEDSHVETQ